MQVNGRGGGRAGGGRCGRDSGCGGYSYNPDDVKIIFFFILFYRGDYLTHFHSKMDTAPERQHGHLPIVIIL